MKKNSRKFYVSRAHHLHVTHQRKHAVIFGNCRKFYRKFSPVLYRKYYWNSALSCTKPGIGNLTFVPVCCFHHYWKKVTKCDCSTYSLGALDQGRRKHREIGPANTKKHMMNYSYFVLRMRRHTPEYMTINKQRQKNINKHLRKIRQQYSTHARATSCCLTPSMHAAREGTRCCAESALAGWLIMKFITLASTLVPQLRYLWYRFRRPCRWMLSKAYTDSFCMPIMGHSGPHDSHFWNMKKVLYLCWQIQLLQRIVKECLRIIRGVVYMLTRHFHTVWKGGAFMLVYCIEGNMFIHLTSPGMKLTSSVQTSCVANHLF